MKKYKHISGAIATFVEDSKGKGYQVESDKWKYWCPIDMIENTKDWEEIQKVLFTTEDGVELFSRSQEIYVIKRGEFKLFEQYNGKGIGVWLNGWYADRNGLHSGQFEGKAKEEFKTEYLAFSSQEKAEEYIKNNEPKYSLKMIKDFIGTKYLIQRLIDDNI